jgi:hypothetical protein
MKFKIISDEGMKRIAKTVAKKNDESPIEDFEYLFHHVLTNEKGEEDLHHCFFYDHLGNIFEQGHLVVEDGKVTIDGKKVTNGIFHFIKGLVEDQDVAWSDEEAEEYGIRPKKMTSGMTFKDKAKEW